MELVKLDENHLEFLLEVRNHESTRKFLENDSIFNIEQCKEWFSNLKSPWFIIMVDNEPVGYIRTDGSDIGCDIHPNHRRKGYAKMAYSKIMQNMDSATLWVFEDNFAKNLYEDIGFVKDNEEKIIRGRKYIKMIYEQKN
jgi:ribosomal protein S18 acetylase RimI-like enzyme